MVCYCVCDSCEICVYVGVVGECVFWMGGWDDVVCGEFIGVFYVVDMLM